MGRCMMGSSNITAGVAEGSLPCSVAPLWRGTGGGAGWCGEGTITIVDEDGVKEEGNRKMVLECFENDDCEITELYDNFIEKVVEDVSSKILRGSDGPFVPSKQRSQVGRDMM